jgi:4'-phosphopantetheinyl transferase
MEIKLGSTSSDRCIFFSPVICQVPKAFQDTNSSCDYLSENWQFSLSELNNSHYMAACIEDDSRTSGLHFVYIFYLVDFFSPCSFSNLLLLVHFADFGNDQLPLGLKIWKTIPFIEDTLVSGTEAVKLIY